MIQSTLMNVIQLFNALNEGEFAFRVGVPFEDCPYDKDTALAEWWEFGWHSEDESRKILEYLCKMS